MANLSANDRDQSQHSDRIDSFESLRGLMALWVVIGHVTLTFHIPEFDNFHVWAIFGQNEKAVDVFIILSGFVIFFLLFNKREPYADYIFRRFMRLFPAYLVCLLLSAILLPISLEAVTALASISPRNISRIGYLSGSLRDFWPHMIAHFTMLHGLVPNRLLPYSDWAILGQAWSISVEWQFYLLAPLVFSLATFRFRWSGIVALLVLMIILQLGCRFLGAGFIGEHSLYFAIGSISAIFWFGDQKWQQIIALHSNLIIPFATLACVFLQPERWQIAFWVCTFLSSIAMRFNVPEKHIASLISTVLLWKPLKYLGKISYSFYLTHMIPLFGTLWLIKDSGISQIAAMSITLVSTLLITLLMSIFMFRWVEAPFIKIGRSIQFSRLFFSNRSSLP